MKPTHHKIHPFRSTLFAALVLLAGCVHHHGYVDPSSMHFDKPEHATHHDMNAMVAALVQRLQDDEGFQEHYDLLASKKLSLPVLQIGNIENYSGDRVQQKLESARRRLETALRKTRLFDIVDDASSAESVSEALAESLTVNADIGLKNGDGLQNFGKHVSADYQIYGRYRSFSEGDRHSHELELQLIDLHSGLQIWSDIGETDKE